MRRQITAMIRCASAILFGTCSSSHMLAAQSGYRGLETVARIDASSAGPWESPNLGAVLDTALLVVDRGRYRLHLLRLDGRAIRSFGRRGQGPGEVDEANELLVCGRDVLVGTTSGEGFSVFTTSGSYVARRKVAAVEAQLRPQTTVCNTRGGFAHVAWGTPTRPPVGRFRPPVRVWSTMPNASVPRVLRTVPGTESIMYSAGRGVVGMRPQPFGYDVLIGMTSQAVVVADTEHPTIEFLSPNGEVVARVTWPATRLTPVAEDIQGAIEEEAVGQSRSEVRASYERMDFSRPLPVVRRLLVDRSTDAVWVENYGRPSSPTRTWFRIDQRGTVRPGFTLPSTTRVLDIRGAVVLASAIDPDTDRDVILLLRMTDAGARWESPL